MAIVGKLVLFRRTVYMYCSPSLSLSKISQHNIYIYRILTPYTKLHTVQQQPIVAPFSESRCRQISFRNCRFPSGALADRLSQGHAHQFHFLEVDFSHEPSLPSKSWLNPLSSTAATNGSFGLPPAVVAEHRWGVPDRPKPLQERMPKQYIYMPCCMCESYI